ncbi:hypothetical protein Micbo1qcDRAFT_154203 [Microdochium bolleyi]|uniref:Uncharacterized protein n=1 Tax=Microdochium bolleyi TaxID=196109 RepID=A0A136IKR8_9PEZI|nr:hypothetical protein Micbo1qcDRAFT_154203 [Microdochium bolleyi]
MTPDEHVLDQDRVVETDVLIVGSGPIGATYARKLVDAGVKVLMVEIGAQETPLPGDHKKNNCKAQKDISSFIKYAITNGQNPMQNASYNLSAAAATRVVGGMASHWTNCTPRQHPSLERSDLFDDQEWDTLYTEAEGRIKTNSTLFDESIRQQLVLKTLQKGSSGRSFISMPLAAQKLPDQTYTEWSSAATVFGDITRTVDRPGNDLFTLKTQIRCTQLMTSHAPGPEHGVIQGALCKDLKTDTNFLVKAQKYVLCAGAVLTPGILFNSGWTPEQAQLPALGKYLTDQTVAFCQIVLSRDLVDHVAEHPDPSWAKRIAEHRNKFPSDPLPFPFSDPDPHVYTPVSEAFPWHAQIHRDAFSYGKVQATVDQRLVVDLRWYGLATPLESNHISFTRDVTDQFGMPQPTFHHAVPQEDADRAHRMMQDMCLIASKLGGYLPGAEPKFLEPGSALHLCGTTRAGTRVEDSVCDRYGRVWGTSNLVVGGCGVIPTANACNPTLTAMCFAIAGADKMVEELRPAPKVAWG